MHTKVVCILLLKKPVDCFCIFCRSVCVSHWMYHGMHGMGDYFLKHGLVFSSNTTKKKKKMIRYPASSHHLLPLPLGQVWDLLSPSLICEAVSPILCGLCRWPQLPWAYEFNDRVMSRRCLFTVHLLSLWLLRSFCFVFGDVPCVLEGVIYTSHLGPNALHLPLFLDFDQLWVISINFYLQL